MREESRVMILLSVIQQDTVVDKRNCGVCFLLSKKIAKVVVLLFSSVEKLTSFKNNSCILELK
jgi:hypothetical protein